MGIRLRGIGVAHWAVLCFAAAASVAAAQRGPVNSDWLRVSSDEAGSLIGVSVKPLAAEAGEEILVQLPGALKTAVHAEDGKRYDSLTVPDCGLSAERVGEPEMPFKGVFLEVPYGVDVQAKLLSSATVSLGRGFRAYPRQPGLPDSGKDEGPPPFEVDDAAYATDALFPAQPVVVGEPGFIRGRRVVFVQVFPLQYNPATTEVFAFESLRVGLAFSGDVDAAGEARRARLATPQFEVLAQDLLENYEPVAPVSRSAAPEISTGDGADYLVIVFDDLHDEILPLAQWKHRKGFRTRVVAMSAVGSTSADVQSYLQNAYDTWTPAPSYVLLVGDADDVPSSYFSGSYSCVSDHPYACVDGSDIYPDLALGRLPVHTAAECSDLVGKILTYERTPDPGDWYDDYLAAGYFQDYNDNNRVADRWFMETTMTVYTFMRDELGRDVHSALCTDYSSIPSATWHFRDSSYPHRGDLNQIRWGVNPYPDPVPQWIVDLWTSPSQATSDVSTAINAGVSIVQHRDHGAETLWGDPHYDRGDINALTNGVKTPVVFSINCQTGSFYRSGGDSFCEAFLKKTPGGSVGIVGATRNSYSGHNDLLVHGIYTCFWPSYDTSYTDTAYSHSWRPCEALNYGKFYMYTFEGPASYTPAEFHMFHWFGDPEMMLRTETPAVLSVTHPSLVASSVPVNITVTVQGGGTDVEGARVALSHPTVESQHWSGLTNVAGAFTFTGVLLSEMGDYDLVVSGHNLAPYEVAITAMPTSEGYIAFDSDLYSCVDTVGVTVGDLDLVGAAAQEVLVTTDGGDRETVVLSETGVDSGLFFSTISTAAGVVSIEDGTVQVVHGETLTGTYEDLDNGSGPATDTDSAAADCQGPLISNVQVSDVGLDSATISFDTGEPATARVRCCDTGCGGPYTIIEEDLNFGLAHAFVLADLAPGTLHYFEVDAADMAGNETTDNNGGGCHSFETDDYLYWFSLDDNPGWSTEGQWEFGVPLGQGGESGHPDPTSGYTGSNVYGYNLGGDYPNNMGSRHYLTTTALDCSYYENIHLHFKRWLGVESSSYDHASVHVSNDGVTWNLVWSNGSSGSDADWTSFDYDISSTADNQSAVYIRWGMGTTDSSVRYCGWNLDDIGLTGDAMDDLRISPSGGFAALGYEGGPFTPPSKTYTLTNNGSDTLDWTASATELWVDVTPGGGALDGGDSATVAVGLNANAASLAPGAYADTVAFVNTGSGVSFARGISLDVLEKLELTPADGFVSFGCEGGPFSPSSETFLVTNKGGAPLDWTASATVPWLDVTPGSGTLAAGDSITVDVALNANAASLTVDGSPYTDTVSITNTDSLIAQQRPVRLELGALPPGPAHPHPEDGALGVPVDTLLNWESGAEAVADGKMYWTDFDTGKIQRANRDGTEVEDLISTGTDSPSGIAFDSLNGKIYWTDAGTDKIQRADLDGSNIEDLVGSGLEWPVDIALDLPGGKMYWTDNGIDKIQRADLDGSNVEDLIDTGLDIPYGIALDLSDEKMYWCDWGTDSVNRAGLDGTNTGVLVTDVSTARGIALDGPAGKVYWTDAGADKVQRANLDGTSVEDLVTTGLSSPDGIALDVAAGKMYWADRDTGKIQRADLDGANVEDLVTGLGQARCIDLGLENVSPISYDVYFGTEAGALALILEGVSEPTCGPGPLESATQYFWQVAARNVWGQTAGPVWSFTTMQFGVTPEAGFHSEGPQSGPFTPAQSTYTLSNHGSGSLEWTAASAAAWLDIAPAGGTLAGGAAVDVVVAANAASAALLPGLYEEMLVFTNVSTSAIISYDVSLSVTEQMSVSPVGGFHSGGPQSGPFAPAQTSYTLTNIGSGSLEWTAASGAAWLDVTPPGDTLIGGAAVDVAVAPNAAAAALLPGLYEETLAFTHLASGAQTIVDVSLLVTEQMTLTPESGLSSSGLEGGPFAPGQTTYTLSNAGLGSVEWTAAGGAAWLDISPAGGTVAAGAFTSVVISINANANSLMSAGSPYTHTVTFTNTTSLASWERQVSLEVGALPPGPANPHPEGGAVGVPIDTLLGWESGADALADGKMYWTDFDTGKIQRSNPDGTELEDVIGSGLGKPSGMALDGANGKVYWTDPGTDKIQRADLDGSNVEDLVSGLQNPIAIALDVVGGKMYWTDNGSDKIQRANLDGSNAEDLITTGLEGSYGIALDLADERMYWCEWGTDTVNRAGLDGTNVEVLVSGLSSPRGIALDLAAAKVYWADFNTAKIQRANLDGTNVEDLITTGLSNPNGVFLDLAEGKTYWTDIGADKIQRADLDGSNVEDLVSGLSAPRFVELGRDTTAALVYDVRFGTDPGALTLLCEGVSDLTCAPGPLDLATEYFWQVIAENSWGQTSGPLWSFTTKQLDVTPEAGFYSEGPQSGPFTPAQTSYTLTNGGLGSLEWTAVSGAAWLGISPSGDTLAGGASVDVVVAPNAAAAALLPGLHEDTLVFTDIASGAEIVVGVSLLITEQMTVTPDTGFASLGAEGGPFTPASTTYRLTNTGALPLDWTAAATEDWIGVVPAGGTISGAGYADVSVSINAHANGLTPAGSPYSGTVTFTNATSLATWQRQVSLEVGPAPAAPANPDPEDGAGGVPVDTLLSWEAGGEASANRKIYWTDFDAGKIQRANFDGTDVEDLVGTGLRKPSGVAIDRAGGKIYWSDPDAEKIQRADLDGSNAEDLVSTGLQWPIEIALDPAAEKVYWTDTGLDQIQRANLDGSNVENVITSGLQIACAIALDPSNDKIYWCDRNAGTINRASLDGTNAEVLVSGLPSPRGITLDAAAAKFYWTDFDSDKIHRANVDGTGVEDLVTIGLSGTHGISLDVAEGKMYWADRDAGKIQRANLDGSNVEDLVVGLDGPWAVDVGLGSASPISYDVYFGTDPGALTLLCEDISDLTCNPGLLDLGTEYFWQVVARNSWGQASGPVWSFTTGKFSATPAAGLSSAGPMGGPFAPASRTYTLTNEGTSVFTWTAHTSEDWVAAVPSSGTLGGGEHVEVDVLIEPGYANLLAGGNYSDVVSFTNTDTGVRHERAVFLEVRAMATLAWGPVPSPQMRDVPFDVTVTALDPLGAAVRAFDGVVDLSAFTRIPATSTIVVSEIDPNTPDRVEFTNVSGAAVDISNWIISVFDKNSWPVPLAVLVVPEGTVSGIDDVFIAEEEGTVPGAYPNFQLGISVHWGAELGVLVQDDWGNIVDFATTGDSTQVVNPMAIPPSEWSGPGIAWVNYGDTYQRTGSEDHNDNSDWVYAPASMGAVNTGLTVPMFGSAPLSIAPIVSTPFVEGVWTGSITALEAGSDVMLRAVDRVGHTGDSALFEVTESLGVIEVTSADADGAYTAPEVIGVDIVFSEAVVVTNTPSLELETGSVDRIVDYTSGSGTSTLTFTYTVDPADGSPDLDYTGVNALRLNGGTIRDAAAGTINALLTLAAPGTPGSLSANKDIVIDNEAPRIAVCTPDPSPVGLDGNCEAVLPDLTSGVVATDNHGTPSITQSPTPGTMILADTLLTFTAVDGAGLTDTCQAIITVEDTIAPAITQLAANTGPLNLGDNCEVALPDLKAGATATDNCGTPSITQSPTAGTMISLDTLVTLTAMDAAGLMYTCDVMVTVEDTTPPTITHVAADTGPLRLDGNCEIPLPDLSVGIGATDNCGTPAITQYPPAGTMISLDTHVTLNAMDAAGLMYTCGVMVSVADTTPPIITQCAPDPGVVLPMRFSGVPLPDLSQDLLSVENCGTAVVSQDPPEGTLISADTPVTLTVMDGAGLTATCEVTVTVTDPVPVSSVIGLGGLSVVLALLASRQQRKRRS